MSSECESPSWNSPYQTEPYFQVHDSIGFRCKSIDIRGKKYYFYQHEGRMIAWELASFPSEYQSHLQISDTVHSLESVENYDQVNWDHSPSYTTVFSKPEDIALLDSEGIPISYSKRFKRSLNKSLRRDLQFRLAETDRQVTEAVSLFNGYPDRRDHHPMSFFDFIVWRYLLAGVADACVIHEPDDSRRILATAIVLKSPDQVNLRYYTAERSSSNPGHFLQHALVMHYLTQGYQVVDHSGISPPDNDEFRGITNFKLQLTQRTAVFR